MAAACQRCWERSWVARVLQEDAISKSSRRHLRMDGTVMGECASETRSDASGHERSVASFGLSVPGGTRTEKSLGVCRAGLADVSAANGVGKRLLQ